MANGDWRETIETHAQRIEPGLARTSMPELRWTLFALKGVFRDALDDSGLNLNTELVVVTYDCSVLVEPYPDRRLSEINQDLKERTGGIILGLSIFTKNYRWCGLILDEFQERGYTCEPDEILPPLPTELAVTQ